MSRDVSNVIPPDLIGEVDRVIKQGLAEDIGAGDITSLACFSEETQATGLFVAKADGVAAGLAVAERVFAHVDPGIIISWNVRDGARVEAGQNIGTVAGDARGALAAERLALNLMQRMSGIASATAALVALSHPTRVLDTRKTAPGLRHLDKWAVRLGGGENHRTGLFDMVLIKDNHIAAAGGISAAMKATRDYLAERDDEIAVEIEVRTLEELAEALETDAAIRETDGRGILNRILLDNMAHLQPDGSVDTSLLHQAVTMIGGSVETEASGMITAEAAAAVAAAGVTYLSSGALTHSVRALDISLKIDLV
ncbi:carboxylating nicotinate-nucleotide diphosphorylase [soil metagenome]